ncbi:unnamed protein product (macronuclear) [Paramecium tetraurelia]|uniref:Uncharacterized protein n=1 Tax=Paramecium tetraurelia TaxID=5888 RepID=A0CGM7_PARTE|nr:uncharacterized protein GSPATT00007384001 [Paramecium tetraurelia]CAK69944.1 unnamed protein product [Paramecium tetraurelia]|eukprot:XP_001437341.1 hypothetical protein (macronuclear) [Paramecium tetraurelia strain d4-2]
MLEGYQKCFLGAVKAIDQVVTNPKDHKSINESLEKISIRFIHIQSYQGMEKICKSIKLFKINID